MAGGTEFLIEIEQRMKGDNPVSELQKTEQALKSAMDKYKALESASLNAGKALERAGANVGAVRAKMAKAMEAGDTSAFWKLAAPLEAAVKKERELAAAADKAKAALKSQEGVVSGLADEVSAAKASAGGDPIDAAKTGDAVNKLGGPLGALGTRVKDLTEGWHGLVANIGKGPAVFAVAAVAVVALTAALIAGAYQAGKFALSSANAARDAHLATAAFIVQTGAAAGLEQAMADVGRSTGVAIDRQKDIVKSLKDANVEAGDWPEALKAIAKQEAALGDSSGTQALIDDLKSGKKSVADLAKEMDTKFGGIAKKRMLGLDQQAKTLEQNVGGIFSGLNIEPILEGIAKLVGLFDDSTASGKALKAIVGAVFQPLINAAGGIFPKIERFFLGMIIGALKVGIAVKKLAKELGFDLGSMESFPDVAKIGEIAAYAIAGALALVAAAGYAIYTAFQNLRDVATILLGIGEASNAAWAAIGEFIAGLPDAAGDALSAASVIGGAIIDGLVQGIQDGAAAVIAAITGVANDAVASAKAVLGIQSPSRVFAEIGSFTAAGMAEGVDEGAPMVTRSIADMVEAPDAPAAKGGGKGGGAQTISATFNFYGVAGAAEAEAQFEEQWTAFMEGKLASVGAAPVPA